MLIVSILIVVPLLMILGSRLENEQPQFTTDLSTPFIGKKQSFQLTAQDPKSGLKQIWVAIFQDGNETILLDKRWSAVGFLRKGATFTSNLMVDIDTANIGLKDGKALLRMMVVDHSWYSWGKGSRAYKELEVVIDTKPPVIKILSKAHNISPGGSNMIVYSLSEPCDQSGVQVGQHFYPGHQRYSDNDVLRIAFFALSHEQLSEKNINLMAKDLAGNETTSDFPHYIKTKRFKKDTIRISDNFILNKLPEFENELSKRSLNSNLDKFLFINKELRKKSKIVLDKLMQNSESSIYWEGAFLRLPRSATRAGYGDTRSYIYKGKIVDLQTHLGIDLASVAMSPVPAANSGKVVYAEWLGIYGRTMVIDHGCGLFSLYAHLSNFNVNVGQMVAKGDIIAQTGKSGLAGGDHLHYSVVVNGTFVNPIEWWDATWIKHNITSKLEYSGDNG